MTGHQGSLVLRAHGVPQNVLHDQLEERVDFVGEVGSVLFSLHRPDLLQEPLDFLRVQFLRAGASRSAAGMAEHDRQG